MSQGQLLEGQVAMVTGGARGIGLGIARELATHGARVAIVDLDPDAATAAASTLPGGGHEALRCNVSAAADCDRAVAEVLRLMGRLDTLVNNAGVHFHEAAEEVDESAWRRLFDVNVHGAMLAARAAGRAMLERGSGSIVTIGSIASLQAMPRRLAYTASKTAIVGLTRGLAVEWAGRGVRVNAVCPGYHRTPLLEEYIADGRLDVERIRTRIPMGRLGSTEDVGRVVVFFASPLSGYVTGQVLMVDGGYTTFGAPEDAA